MIYILNGIRHTLTLGVMVSFMLGALFQMLPVIAGVALSSPVKRSWWIQAPFALGTITLLLHSISPPVANCIVSHRYSLAAVYSERLSSCSPDLPSCRITVPLHAA